MLVSFAKTEMTSRLCKKKKLGQILNVVQKNLAIVYMCVKFYNVAF